MGSKYTHRIGFYLSLHFSWAWGLVVYSWPQNVKTSEGTFTCFNRFNKATSACLTEPTHISTSTRGHGEAWRVPAQHIRHYQTCIPPPLCPVGTRNVLPGFAHCQQLSLLVCSYVPKQILPFCSCYILLAKKFHHCRHNLGPSILKDKLILILKPAETIIPDSPAASKL